MRGSRSHASGSAHAAPTASSAAATVAKIFLKIYQKQIEKLGVCVGS